VTNPDSPTLAYHTPQGAGLYSAPRFRSVHGVGIALITIIACATIISLVQGVLLYLQVGLIESIKGGAQVTAAQVQTNDLRVSAAVRLSLLMILTGMVVWLIWFYRAYSNLPFLTGRPAEHSKGWAIGAYFVPFLNLVRVPNMLSETWKGSDPVGASGGVFIVLWWLAWIASGILSRVAEMTMEASAAGPPDLDSLIAGSWMFLVCAGFEVISGILAITIVAGICVRQRRKAVIVQSGQYAAPAPQP